MIGAFLKLVKGMARVVYFQGAKFEDEPKPVPQKPQPPRNQPLVQQQGFGKPTIRR